MRLTNLDNLDMLDRQNYETERLFELWKRYEKGYVVARLFGQPYNFEHRAIDDIRKVLLSRGITPPELTGDTHGYCDPTEPS